MEKAVTEKLMGLVDKIESIRNDHFKVVASVLWKNFIIWSSMAGAYTALPSNTVR
jgi:hypothetical protein